MRSHWENVRGREAGPTAWGQEGHSEGFPSECRGSHRTLSRGATCSVSDLGLSRFSWLWVGEWAVGTLRAEGGPVRGSLLSFWGEAMWTYILPPPIT